MLKRKLSILLCTVLIAGSFAQAAYADEVKTTAAPANQTTNEQKATTEVKDSNETKDSNAAKEDAAKTTEDKKDTAATPATKRDFPKVDFDMLTPNEAFDTEFHSLSYQEGLRNRCLKQQTKIESYFSLATLITCDDAKYSQALDKIHECKKNIFNDGYMLEAAKIDLNSFELYKASNKNLSKDALNALAQYKNTTNDTISQVKEVMKKDIAEYNKYLKQARSCETPENSKDLENVLIAYIMQDYCGDNVKSGLTNLNDMKRLYKDNLTQMLKNTLQGKPLTVTTAAKKPAKTTAKVTTTAAKTSSKKSLPKTGGVEAAPIASLALIASGAFVAIVNKVKRH